MSQAILIYEGICLFMRMRGMGKVEPPTSKLEMIQVTVVFQYSFELRRMEAIGMLCD